MASSVPGFYDQLKTLLASLTPARKITLLGIVVLTISGMIFIISWSGRSEFGILYNNLSPNDAGMILEQLREKKIGYQISGKGGSVLIPVNLIYETRMELASEGLPRGGGIGFEIFDNVKLGMTEFVQNINYQRALQGELSRTINRFDEVVSSRVHIVMSSKSLFIDKEEPASASVVLKLRSGSWLSDDQIRGIVHLVSSSVSGLRPENVTIIDNKGRMPAGFADQNGTSKVSSDQLEFKGKIEKSLEKNVKTMLDRVLGDGKSVVRVACSIDFKQHEQTEEIFKPENQVARSEQFSEEVSNGLDIIPAGVPGVSSNISPQKKQTTGSGEKKIFSKQDKTINYEIGKIINHIVEPVGTIKRLSVAVMVDGIYKPGAIKQGKNRAVAAGGKRSAKKSGAPKENIELEYFPRTKEEMAQLENIVKRAINFDDKRGDVIEIVNIPFETSEIILDQDVAAPQTWFEKVKDNKSLFRYSFAGLVLMLSFLFIIRPLVKWLTSNQGGNLEMLKQLPMTVSEIEKVYSKEMKDLPFRKKALEMVKTDSEHSAKLLSNWLKD